MASRVESMCRLCGHVRPLIEAHIYPRAIALRIGGPGDVPRTHIVDASEPPKKTPAGWYDATILCAECDGTTLGALDSTGVDFVRLPLRHEDLTSDGGEPILRLPGVDARKLKLFAMSLLWRASISNRPEFQGVKLGTFENDLRDRIRTQHAGLVDDFSVMVTRCENDPGEMMVPPFKTRFRGGPNVYLMHLGRHTFAVKVDSRPAPFAVRRFLLKDDHEAVALLGSVTAGPIGSMLRRFFEKESAAERTSRSRSPTPAR